MTSDIQVRKENGYLRDGRPGQENVSKVHVEDLADCLNEDRLLVQGSLQGNNGRIDKTCPNQGALNYIKLTENCKIFVTLDSYC